MQAIRLGTLLLCVQGSLFRTSRYITMPQNLPKVVYNQFVSSSSTKMKEIGNETSGEAQKQWPLLRKILFYQMKADMKFFFSFDQASW